MSSERKKLGQFGEELAQYYLEKKGFKFIAKNIRLFCGEIDLLMEDKTTLVIVEVKTKRGEVFGEPKEEVDYFKQKKLLQLGKALSQKYPKKDIRIDVLAIKMGDKPEIEHIRNAVELKI